MANKWTSDIYLGNPGDAHNRGLALYRRGREQDKNYSDRNELRMIAQDHFQKGGTEETFPNRLALEGFPMMGQEYGKGVGVPTQYSDLEQIEGLPGYYGQKNLKTNEYALKVKPKTPLVQIGPGGEPVQQAPADSPYSHIRDPKEFDKAKHKSWVDANKEVSGLEKGLKEAKTMNPSIERFMFLNEKTKTGPVYGSEKAVAARGLFDPDIVEMKSITDKLTPAMRQGLPGAASERDTAMFRSATIGTTKPYEANKNVATGLMVHNQNMIDEVEFYRAFVDDKGHSKGMKTAWKRYLEANPIFDPKAPPGSYTINQERMPYQEFFALPEKEQRRLFLEAKKKPSKKQSAKQKLKEKYGLE